ncbi:TPA: hypothetical protein ACIKKY_001895, partial [Streptococcus pneumoniae]
NKNTPKVRFFLSNFWGVVHKNLGNMRFNVGRFTSFSTEIESFPKIFLYSMKIKVQTRKLAAGCSKQCFEVADGSRRGLKRFSKSIT